MDIGLSIIVLIILVFILEVLSLSIGWISNNKSEIFSPLFAVIAFLIGVTLTYSILVKYDMLVIANFSLVFVTAIYVILTWGMVGEMRKQRETQFEPWLKFYVTLTRNRDNLTMIIENTGAGPAKNAYIECDPDITYPPDPNKKLSEAFGIIKRIAPNVHISKNLTHSLYIPGFSERSTNFLGLDVLIDELKKYNFKFDVTVHWEDNFGKPYENLCQIDLHEYLRILKYKERR